MNRYRQFGSEFEPPSSSSNTAAILPDIEIDEPFQLDFHPHLSEYQPKTNRCRQCLSHRTKLERFLIYLLILLLITLFSIIIISLSYQKKFSNDSLCLSSACIELSHTISSSMNQSIHPCDNFYEFVCGRWKQIHLMPKGYSSWSVTSDLTQKISILLKNLLEHTTTSSINTIEQQPIHFYQSCLNNSQIERLGLQPLKDFFQNNLNFSIDQWIQINKTQTWQKLFVQLTNYFAKNLATTFAFPIVISTDEKNSSWNNVYVNCFSIVLIYFVCLLRLINLNWHYEVVIIISIHRLILKIMPKTNL